MAPMSGTPTVRAKPKKSLAGATLGSPWSIRSVLAAVGAPFASRCGLPITSVAVQAWPTPKTLCPLRMRSHMSSSRSPVLLATSGRSATGSVA